MYTCSWFFRPASVEPSCLWSGLGSVTAARQKTATREPLHIDQPWPFWALKCAHHPTPFFAYYYTLSVSQCELPFIFHAKSNKPFLATRLGCGLSGSGRCIDGAVSQEDEGHIGGCVRSATSTWSCRVTVQTQKRCLNTDPRRPCFRAG